MKTFIKRATILWLFGVLVIFAVAESIPFPEKTYLIEKSLGCVSFLLFWFVIFVNLVANKNSRDILVWVIGIVSTLLTLIMLAFLIENSPISARDAPDWFFWTYSFVNTSTFIFGWFHMKRIGLF